MLFALYGNVFHISPVSLSLCDCKRSHGRRSKSLNYRTHSVILYISCSEESHSATTVGFVLNRKRLLWLRKQRKDFTQMKCVS